MKTKYLVTFSIISLLVIILAGVALAADTPMGTGFTYQGFLKYLTNPADAAYDFEFRCKRFTGSKINRKKEVF